jgi:YD repeat-containing protein
VTQFNYDTRDNLLSLTDANGHTTRFEYDGNNRKTKETRPLGQSTTYTYDAVGQLIEVTDAQGNTHRYSHDAAGRPVKEEQRNKAGQLTRTMTGITDSNSGHADHQSWRSEITVDALQRKTREAITLGNQTVSFATTYSATGRKASQSLADGALIAYRYDQSTDELNAIELPGAGTISLGSRTWGQVKQITYPGGSERQHDYDALLRLQKIQVKSAGQQALMQRQYSFDAESNITGQQTEYGSIAYGYDSLYRLTQVTPSINSGLGLPTERFRRKKMADMKKISVCLLWCGASQDSCRLIHAAHRVLFSAWRSRMAASRSGLSVTALSGDQSRVFPDQRAGLSSRAWRYV